MVNTPPHSPKPLTALALGETVLLEFAADFGELHQAGLHGKRQLAG